MQGKRTRALDTRGRAVPGLYVRDGQFHRGLPAARRAGKWRMVTLEAETLTEARREREAMLAGLREDEPAPRDAATVAVLFADFQQSRNLSSEPASTSGTCSAATLPRSASGARRT